MNPVKGRVLILPRTGVPFVNMEFFITFMRATLVALGLPRGIPETSDAVYTKIKVWGHPAFKGWLPSDLLVGKLLDAWSVADAMLGDSTNIRAVCSTGTMNPSFRLADYAKKDSENKFRITVHFVLGLRGGGGPTITDHASLVKQKNELAAFCLGQGGELQHVTSFVDKISKASSPATIEAVLSPKSSKDRLEAISKLAKTLNIAIPDFAAPNLRRRDKIRDRVNLPAKEMAANIDLSGVRIKEGFFLNEDQSACQQIPEVIPQASGVCLLDSAQSVAWLAHRSNLSQDELAIVVLGRCDCPPHTDGKRIQIPAFCANGEPLVLAGCLHNLGHKKVSTSRVDSNILTPDSTVVSFTVCKDELNPEKWEEVIKAPVKATLSICGAEINLLAPPWGRVFQRLKTKVPAEEATSLQFHVRISKDDLIKVLQLSGTKGIYTTAAKSEKSVMTIRLSGCLRCPWLIYKSPLLPIPITEESFAA